MYIVERGVVYLSKLSSKFLQTSSSHYIYLTGECSCVKLVLDIVIVIIFKKIFYLKTH